MKKVNIVGVKNQQLVQNLAPKVMVNGVEMTGRGTIEIAGTAVSAVDNAVESKTTVTIGPDAPSISQGSVTLNSSADFNATGTSYSSKMKTVNNELALSHKFPADEDTFATTDNIDDTTVSGAIINNNVRILKSFSDYGTGQDGDFYRSGGSNNFSDLSYGYRVTEIGYDYVTIEQTDIWNRKGSSYVIPAGIEFILINQRGWNGQKPYVGNYEYCTVLSHDKPNNRLYFTKPISKLYGYATGVQTLYNQLVRIYQVPHFNNCTFANGYTLYPNEWNEDYGGIVCFKVKGLLTVMNGSSINGDYRGYRQSVYRSYQHADGDTGRSGGGSGGQYLDIDLNNVYNSGSGGHRYNGKANGTNPGYASNVDLTLTDRIFMGGGGAYKHDAYDQALNGGRGGAIIIMHAAETNIAGGYFYARGEATGGYHDSRGGAGGGAGGSILLKTEKITMGSNCFYTYAVVGANADNTGSEGITAIHYNKKVGTDFTVSPQHMYYSFDSSNGAYKNVAVFASNDLIADSRYVQSITKAYVDLSSLPPFTTAKMQISTDDGVTWKSCDGVIGAKTSLTFGANEITLVGVNDPTNFKYKIELTTDGSDTPVIERVAFDFQPKNYAITDETWSSATIKRTDGKRFVPTNLRFVWAKGSAGNVEPKFRLIGSDDSNFSSYDSYPATGEYYQLGTAFDVYSNVPFDVSGVTANKYRRYWKFLVVLNAGGDVTATPKVTELALDYDVEPINYAVSAIEVARSQTVISCAVNSSGRPNFAATDSTAKRVTISGNSSPLVLSFGVGKGMTKVVEFTGNYDNFQFTANVKNYLYAYIDTTGSLQFRCTTFAPWYDQTFSTGSEGQFFFNYAENVNYVFTGGGWIVSPRLYLGEMDVDVNGAPSNLILYSPNGRWSSGWMNIAVTTAYTMSHNLGCVNPKIERALVRETTTGNTGDAQLNGGMYGITSYGMQNRNSMTIRTGNTPYWDAVVSYTSNLQMLIDIDRGWL